MALLNVSFFSEVLGMNTQMDVILPTGIKGQIDKSSTDKIPTLYLLHGMSDDHTSWRRKSLIETYVNDLGIAVVMPTTHLGWYTDMAYGNKYFTYISDELPKICRALFNNLSDKREDNFVAGLSMGGYGAFKLGLACSDTFSMAASLSGALDINEIVNGKSMELSDKQFWINIFGDLSKLKNSENDLFYLAKKLKGSSKPIPKLFMCCGREDFLYEINLNMKTELESLGYDFIYEESSGDHDWEYWNINIQVVLDWIVKSKS